MFMARVDGIFVFCQIPTDDIKGRHPDIRNEYRNFLARLSEVASERKIKVYAPYLRENKREYYFRTFEGIEHMVFFGDELGLKRMCMTANMGSTFWKIAGRKRVVMMITNSHDDEMIGITTKRMKLRPQDITEVMIENGEYGFRDSVDIIERISGPSSN